MKMLKRSRRRVFGLFLISFLSLIGTIGCGGGGPNNAPIAKARTDHGVLLAGVATAKLDGSASTDPDGDSITFRWSITSAPAGSTAAINDPTSPNPTFSPDVIGEFFIQLVVNDHSAQSDPVSMTITGKKMAVYGDYTGSQIADFLTKRGIAVDNVPGTSTLNNITDYCMILFGDNLLSANALAVFYAADQTGVNMLGIGTYDNDLPLGVILSQNSRFGLSYDDDYLISPMQVDASAGTGHPVFSGINTSGILIFESSMAIEKDEQAYYTDPTDPESPADWKELAVLGPNMRFKTAPAIVEFSTANNTKVILDGSANTYDSHDYWTQARWDVLYNEVLYLAE